MSKNYTIYADKGLQYQEKLKEILASLSPSEYDLIKMDLSEDSIISLLNEIEAAPFLFDLRVVVLENPEFLYKKDVDERLIEQFMHFIKNPVETTVLITLITSDDKSKMKDDMSKTQKDLLKAMKESTNQITLSLPTPKDTDDIIEREMQGYRMSSRAKEELKSRVNADMTRLYVELDKLKLYKDDTKEIGEDDVVLMVSRDLEDKAYNLSSAIISRKRSEALLILSDLKKSGIKINDIFQAIINKISEMYQTRLLSSSGYEQEAIASYYGYNPKRVYYMIKDANKYPLTKLKDELHKLLTMEYDYKRGAVDLEKSLELYILSI